MGNVRQIVVIVGTRDDRKWSSNRYDDIIYR